jgi:hypothetical protein
VNIIREGTKIYLVDDDGRRHRVHDYAMGPPHSQPGKRKRFPPGDARANHRAFVTVTGSARVYHFRKGEKPGIDDAEIVRTFNASEFAPTAKFDPMSRNPERK